MSLGELIPENVREPLGAAAAQLPWDIYADIGSVYLAVLLQDTGWVMPRTFSVSHDAPEFYTQHEMDAENDPQPPADIEMDR